MRNRTVLSPVCWQVWRRTDQALRPAWIRTSLWMWSRIHHSYSQVSRHCRSRTWRRRSTSALASASEGFVWSGVNALPFGFPTFVRSSDWCMWEGWNHSRTPIGYPRSSGLFLISDWRRDDQVSGSSHSPSVRGNAPETCRLRTFQTVHAVHEDPDLGGFFRRPKQGPSKDR